MRIDPVVALTLMLFSIIVAATSVSMSWGYALGRSALRGVTQPDVRPTATVSQTENLAAPTGDGSTSAEIETDSYPDMVFWSETTIIEEVKTQMNY
ncbi:MAG: hypothetical protein VKJ64_08630 [Leptolyngbyaceae bacterium]|nr:hypothetical protein [Leptolyngbyaceae bacterium]